MSANIAKINKVIKLKSYTKSRSVNIGIGIPDIAHHLDDLIRIKKELRKEERISGKIVAEVMNRELSSKEIVALFKDIPVDVNLNTDAKQILRILRNIPKKLYFFLWSLRNSKELPIEGIISSFELKKAIFYLSNFLTILESYLERVPNSIPLYEHLGFACFDLAGIAQFSRRGLLLNGNRFLFTGLLRKAIECFQTVIKLEAYQAKSIDASHSDILKLIDNDFNLKENRAYLYVNPWHFLYISSALRQLNDKEFAELYLKKARSILNAIDDHQNPNIVAQKELLEAVYSTLYHGYSVYFDFDQSNLEKIKKNLKRMRKNKEEAHNENNGYSPIVEEALASEYRAKGTMIRNGKLGPEQISYLRGIYSLYKQTPSSIERDKLIYRLNIPPLKVTGTPSSITVIRGHNPPSSQKLNSTLNVTTLRRVTA